MVQVVVLFRVRTMWQSSVREKGKRLDDHATAEWSSQSLVSLHIHNFSALLSSCSGTKFLTRHWAFSPADPLLKFADAEFFHTQDSFESPLILRRKVHSKELRDNESQLHLTWNMMMLYEPVECI